MRGRRCGQGHASLRVRVRAVVKDRLDEAERKRKEKEEQDKKNDLKLDPK